MQGYQVGRIGTWIQVQDTMIDAKNIKKMSVKESFWYKGCELNIIHKDEKQDSFHFQDCEDARKRMKSITKFTEYAC